MDANLRGVWAKWQRACEQLEALHREVVAFGSEPHAWTIVTQVDRQSEQARYLFRLDPAWPPSMPLRWGAIVGEIVHDLRSLLDHLVAEFVALEGEDVLKSHRFPLWSYEPSEGFAGRARKTWTDPRGVERYGSLYGVSDEATAVIEKCQPYHGGDRVLLSRLHEFWNRDKHQALVPTRLQMAQPLFDFGGESPAIIDFPGNRFDGDTYVMEITVAGSDTHVDVQANTPQDIAFSVGEPIITELKSVLIFILNDVLKPAGELFPDGAGDPPM
jgi:hypothetical protein